VVLVAVPMILTVVVVALAAYYTVHQFLYYRQQLIQLL
jgi:hypothetical protein